MAQEEVTGAPPELGLDPASQLKGETPPGSASSALEMGAGPQGWGLFLQPRVKPLGSWQRAPSRGSSSSSYHCLFLEAAHVQIRQVHQVC